MTLVVLGSLHGAPGVTTTALAITGCLENGVLVEADLDGGMLAAAYGLGGQPGLTSYAADTGDTLLPHTQGIGGVKAIVGPDDPASAEALWDASGHVLAKRLAAAEENAVVDAGRLRANPIQAPLLEVADVVAVLVRPLIQDMVWFARQGPRLRDQASYLVAVRAGDGPCRASDIAKQLDVEVLGEVPNDPASASVLAGEDRFGRGFPRGATLPRAARSLAASLMNRVGVLG